MRTSSLVAALFLLACTGATETNVSPAPCTRAEECAPGQRCAPLDGAAPSDGGTPLFCQAPG